MDMAGRAPQQDGIATQIKWNSHYSKLMAPLPQSNPPTPPSPGHLKNRDKTLFGWTGNPSMFQPCDHPSLLHICFTNRDAKWPETSPLEPLVWLLVGTGEKCPNCLPSYYIPKLSSGLFSRADAAKDAKTFVQVHIAHQWRSVRRNTTDR